MPVGQLYLMSIGFKMKYNMVSERALTLGPCLRFCCDEHLPFMIHASIGQLHLTYIPVVKSKDMLISEMIRQKVFFSSSAPLNPRP